MTLIDVLTVGKTIPPETTSGILIARIRRLAAEEIAEGRLSEMGTMAVILATRHEVLLGSVLGREAAIHEATKGLSDAEVLEEVEVRR